MQAWLPEMQPWPGDALSIFGPWSQQRRWTKFTSKLLPPGTPVYRSPDALAFVRAFRRHPTAHYPASTCDDLFALGVMAYRLVTDVYPPTPYLEEPGSELWREGGPGPRPVRELNPRVSPELEALISRLLAWAPEERFNG